MNKPTKETPKYIQDFMDEVYDGYGALALSSFNETKALIDATEKIRELKKKIAALIERDGGPRVTREQINDLIRAVGDCYDNGDLDEGIYPTRFVERLRKLGVVIEE